MSQVINAVPAGYELNFDSTEPVWFGPEFENQSFANWDFQGFEVVVIADGGHFAEHMTLERAKEVHRQLDGLLTLMGELPDSAAA